MAEVHMIKCSRFVYARSLELDADAWRWCGIVDTGEHHFSRCIENAFDEAEELDRAYEREFER